MNTKSRFLGIWVIGCCLLTNSALAQSPSPESQDKRGLGVQSSSSANNSQSNAQSREAKPELVLQTGYSNFFGAMRLVFSPDARLLATGTFRSGTVKLWETATGRELRNLSSGPQSGFSMAPYIAFSRDGRLIAASAGNNSVKVWEVGSGKEIQTLSGSQSGIAASIAGVYFIAFDANGRLVTISDAIRVWDVSTGQELRSLNLSPMNTTGLMGGEGGAVITPDGTQLAFIQSDGSGQKIKLWDLNNGREVRSVDLDDKDLQSPDLVFAADGHLLAAGLMEKKLKLWDVTAKKERDFGASANEFSLVKMSRDGRLLALADGYKIRLWEVSSGRELSGLTLPNSGQFSQQARAFVSFTDDGKRLATGGFDTPTILWDADTGRQLVKMTGRTNMAYKVAFSADGTRLSSGGRTRWDLRTGRGMRLTAAPTDKGFLCRVPTVASSQSFHPAVASSPSSRSRAAAPYKH